MEITQTQKGILKALTKQRVAIWVKRGESEKQMKAYLGDARWQKAMSAKVQNFEREHFQ